MTDHAGRRKPKPADPTDEPTSDPVPAGEDILARHAHGRHTTPRRYDEDDAPSARTDEPTVKTRI